MVARPASSVELLMSRSFELSGIRRDGAVLRHPPSGTVDNHHCRVDSRGEFSRV